MKKSRLLGAVCACLTVVSFNAGAAIVSVDWKTPGDNLITRDTSSGKEWLDLTATVNRSRVDIRSELGVGGEFEGWNYASYTAINTFFDAFGGSGNYDGRSTENNGLFDLIAPYWGDLYCANSGCNPGEGGSKFLTSGVYNVQLGDYWLGTISDLAADSGSATSDYVNSHHYYTSETTFDLGTGSALFRYTSAVPIPAAAWLFGTGLLGLIGVGRR
jgi:hypothetical protein